MPTNWIPIGTVPGDIVFTATGTQWVTLTTNNTWSGSAAPLVAAEPTCGAPVGPEGGAARYCALPPDHSDECAVSLV